MFSAVQQLAVSAKNDRESLFYDLWMPVFLIPAVLLFVLVGSYWTARIMLRRLRKQKCDLDRQIEECNAAQKDSGNLTNQLVGLQDAIQTCRGIKVACLRLAIFPTIAVLIMMMLLIWLKQGQ